MVAIAALACVVITLLKPASAQLTSTTDNICSGTSKLEHDVTVLRSTVRQQQVQIAELMHQNSMMMMQIASISKYKSDASVCQ